MNFHPRNIKHWPSSIVGGILIGSAIYTVIQKYTTWTEAGIIITMGAGFLGIGPSRTKNDENSPN